MGKIIRNGIEYCGTSDTADNIIYDNTDSGLTATNTQTAIDELSEKVKSGGNIVYLTKAEYEALPDSKLTDDVEYRITDANTAAKIAATDITYGDGTVQTAMDEVNTAMDEVQESVGALTENLGGLRFGYDGDSGTYGYYGADGSLIPFKSGDNKLLFIGGENEYIGDLINPKTFSTVKYIDDSYVELINSNTGLKIKTDMIVLVILKVTNTQSSYYNPDSYCYLNGSDILFTNTVSNTQNSFGISYGYFSVFENDVITVGAGSNEGNNSTQLLIFSCSDGEKINQFINSYGFDGL